MIFSSHVRSSLIGALLAAQTAGAAWAAGDPVAGKALYTGDCVSCHGSNPSSVSSGSTAAALQGYITSVGAMNFLSSTLSATDVANIAAYIANPNGATAAPAYSPSTTSLSFGSLTVMSSSTAMTATISNTGSAALAISAVTLGGTNPGDFALASGGGNCGAGSSVAAGSSCSISAVFTPQAAGARSASITIAHNATGSPGTISLSGTGSAAAAPAVSLSATTLGFGNQPLNSVSTAKTLTVTNSGTAALMLSGLAVSGTNATEFALGSGGSCQSGTSLQINASCTVSLTFTPGALGSRAASLDIASNASGSPAHVALSGTGVTATVAAPGVSGAPNPVAFGNVTVGANSAARTVTLTNTGTATLSMTSVGVTGTGFVQGTSTCGSSLAPNATCTVDVSFAPTASGAASGVLGIASNAPGSPYAVMLTGNGTDGTTSSAAASLAPAALDFGGQALNTSGMQKVTLANKGSAALNVTGLKISGSQAAEFKTVSNCPGSGTVAPNTSCTIAVIFTPAGTGTRTATLTLQSN